MKVVDQSLNTSEAEILLPFDATGCAVARTRRMAEDASDTLNLAKPMQGPTHPQPLEGRLQQHTAPPQFGAQTTCSSPQRISCTWPGEAPKLAVLMAQVRGQDQGRSGRIPLEEARDRTQSRGTLPPNLRRVNEAAKRDRTARFTALLHHVDAVALTPAFRRLRRGASAGVDGETVASYEVGLESNLQSLCERVHTGRCRPLPVRRV
jgi:hypothetical protein